MKKKELTQALDSAARELSIVSLELETARRTISVARSDEVAIRELGVEIRNLLAQANSRLVRFDIRVKRLFGLTWDELRDRDEQIDHVARTLKTILEEIARADHRADDG